MRSGSSPFSFSLRVQTAVLMPVLMSLGVIGFHSCSVVKTSHRRDFPVPPLVRMCVILCVHAFAGLWSMLTMVSCVIVSPMYPFFGLTGFPEFVLLSALMERFLLSVLFPMLLHLCAVVV